MTARAPPGSLVPGKQVDRCAGGTEASAWAEVLHDMAQSHAEAATIQSHCDKWANSEGTEAVRTHLSSLPANQLASVVPAIEWLFTREGRTAAESELQLAAKLLSVLDREPSQRAGFLATICQFADKKTAKLVYRTLVSEPSDWPAVLDALAQRRAEPTIIERHCQKWTDAEGIESLRLHLGTASPKRLRSLAPAVEYLFTRQDRLAPESDLPVAAKVLAAGNRGHSFRGSFLATLCEDNRVGELVYRTLVSKASDWAAILDRLAERQAKGGTIENHCEKWAQVQGIAAIQTHLRKVPAQRLTLLSPAVKWLLTRKHRVAPESDLPLAAKVLASGGHSPSFRGSFIATASRDKRCVDVAYRTLFSEPSDWAAVFDHLAERQAKLTVIERHLDRWTDAQGIAAIRVHLSGFPPERLAALAPQAAATVLRLCVDHGWAELRQALLAAMDGWSSDAILSAANYSKKLRDRITSNALVDILVVRDDLSPEQLALTAKLVDRCGRRREASLFARRARLAGVSGRPELSDIILRGFEHDPELVNALEDNDFRKLGERLAVYAPEQASALKTLPIRSVREICEQFEWPYETCIASSEVPVHKPRYVERHGTNQTQSVIHPPIYRAELRNAIVYGGSWLIEAAGSGAYEPMQGPRSERFIHRDSVSQFGAKRRLLYRRTRPERCLPAAIWLLGAAANNYYHWLYDICSRWSAYRQFSGFPVGTAILIDEAAAEVPQMLEILDAMNRDGLPVETVPSGQAVQAERLFVAAPSTWSVMHLRDTAEPLESLDSIIHPIAVSELRSIAAPYLRRLRPGRRIFLSRKGATSPRLHNEVELAALAEADFGFEVLDPSALTFAEQARAFSEAELIVGASGSAMSNLAFCSQGSRAYCLIAREYDYSAWPTIAAAAGCEVTYIAGKPLPGFVKTEYHAQFTVAPDRLRNALRQALTSE